ncbi:putative inactive shikimate kinase like 2 [Carex littledalei]|uniref:Putative inactive shikimate kinase like 2 n=1 Tax=Carex littledalei TaxID=544730 RepID=A0A833QZT9_9POAL|nr:putative inactive shikimate kinase like 2 [Carex littledalei]
MASSLLYSPTVPLQNPSKALTVPTFSLPRFTSSLSTRSSKLHSLLYSRSTGGLLPNPRSASSKHLSLAPADSKNYEFSDTGGEVELRLDIRSLNIESSGNVFVDADDTSLLIRAKSAGILKTLIDVNRLFERIKSSETIWYIDEEQLVVNLKKIDPDLKWPDIMESWESLTSGISQLLKGTSIYIIGNSTEINEAVAKEIATGIGYMPLSTSELLEQYAQQSIESWVASEGADSVVEAEGVVLENLSSQVRAVVATLGGKHGAASRFDRWRHLHSGFSVWVSKSQALDEASAKEEARKHVQEGSVAYTNADVIVKIGGWDKDHTRDVAQGCLSALKQLTLSDKKLSGKKSLYIRLGCRGDWPDIKPPGWDPSGGVDPPMGS